MNSTPQMPDPAPAASPPRGHWPDLARLWELTGSPLRPSAQDTGFLSAAVESWARAKGAAPRALILGVTPETYRLPWPAGADVMAADHTQAMIDTIWPGPRDAVIRAEWTCLPLPAGSRDIVLCDGGFHLLPHPQAQRQFIRAIHPIIAPGGLCIFRLFTPPPQREAPEAVLEDLLAARIANLNILKLRLGMALQADKAEGVELRHVWNTLHRAAPDFARLAAQIGWPLEHLLAINTYRDCPARSYFLGLEEVCEMFCENPGGFRCEAVHTPSYALGERCPTAVFRRV
jgi:SAM-dependent methyltransferase